MELSDSERAAFFSDGFFVKQQVFERNDIEAMRAGFDRVWDLAQSLVPCENGRIIFEHEGARLTYEDKAVRHIAWCGKVESVLAKFGGDQRLKDLARSLLNSMEIEQLINQAHYKMPGDNVAFPWHQDIEHRGAKIGKFKDVNGCGSYVQIAIPLDDVTPDNGPVGMIPGSCRQGHLHHEILPNGSKAISDELIDASKAIYPQPQIGDILVFGPYTVHGSTSNTSQQWRRVFINGFAAEGANRGAPGIKWND